ncbi:hypothetical protein D9757_002118 [Collybiopsis confluens]|uniref:SPRY-domain-containing protein n=1 Tax=Collybiopsis confluens TaxID=2823264 RepID=A0A8H5MG25_9AGAR|nr:hypothetical protein D9757_002118 [Collybiopsis confluens]
MTSRPPRSASIPIPRASVSTSLNRNIESLISIPFITNGARPRLQSQGNRTASDDHHRGVGVAHGVRGASSSAVSTSPVRATARSFTQPVGSHFRTPSRSAATHEPRIIRAESSRNIDPSCLPSHSSSNSPVRTRRPSTAAVQAPSIQRNRSTSISQSRSTPASFPPPAYLDHSSFKHFFQTESPVSSLVGSKADSDSRTYSGVRSPPIDSDDDSNASPPPREPPVMSVASPDQPMRLPTRWSHEYRHSSLNLSENGRDLSFAGTSCNAERDTAAATRSVHPIPPACGVYYYEVQIHSKDQKAHISVGFAGPDVKLYRLPGWETNSWGYHGDDGCSFAAERNGTSYGPTFGLGDIIGCGIDFSTHRAFFTKNGTYLGPVFENVGRGIELYPTVGLQHIGESVKVNFGHEPFRFDIDYHVQQQRQLTWAKIMTRPLDPTLFVSAERSAATEEDAVPALPPATEQQTKQTINKLVFAYLAHHGYIKTARAFQKQTQGTAAATEGEGEGINSAVSGGGDDIEMDDVPGRSTLEADIELRTKIVNSVLSGEIDSALQETRDHYPRALVAEDGLMLVNLRCRKFVELVLETAELDKKMKAAIAREEVSTPETSELEDGMGMDVDDETLSGSETPVAANGRGGFRNGVVLDGTGTTSSLFTEAREMRSRPPSARELSTGQYEAALNAALAYGQTLDKDFKATENPEAKDIFLRTFAILTSSDPLTAGGAITEVAGHDARVQLANELNQAILRSQGRPADPALEMMYRHTAVCLLQLGLSRVGAAAFANMQKEFLDA